MMSSVAPLEPTPAAPDLADLHREHYRSLVRLASILVDDVGTCEEIVQEAFVNVLRRRATVEPDRFPAYLRSAVLNGARSSLRRRVVRQRHLQAVADPVLRAVGRGGEGVVVVHHLVPGWQFAGGTHGVAQHLLGCRNLRMTVGLVGHVASLVRRMGADLGAACGVGCCSAATDR